MKMEKWKHLFDIYWVTYTYNADGSPYQTNIPTKWGARLLKIRRWWRGELP